MIKNTKANRMQTRVCLLSFVRWILSLYFVRRQILLEFALNPQVNARLFISHRLIVQLGFYMCTRARLSVWLHTSAGNIECGQQIKSQMCLCRFYCVRCLFALIFILQTFIQRMMKFSSLFSRSCVCVCFFFRFQFSLHFLYLLLPKCLLLLSLDWKHTEPFAFPNWMPIFLLGVCMYSCVCVYLALHVSIYFYVCVCVTMHALRRSLIRLLPIHSTTILRLFSSHTKRRLTMLMRTFHKPKINI